MDRVAIALGIQRRNGPPRGQSATTIVDLLCERASSEPDRVAYAFVQDAQGTLVTLTYRELFLQASGFAALLQERGYAGERVLLVFKSNELFIIAFYACLLAGAIAVPTSPPRRAHLSERLGLLARNAQALAGIPDSDDVMQTAIGLGQDDVEWFDIRALMQRDELRPRAAAWRPPALTADSLAFLQYTSGSTGEPKGVMVSHGNLMANSAVIMRCFGNRPETRGLIALPLFHDMGLVGGVVQAVFAGFPLHLMTPAQLVQNPTLWLELISRLRITASGGPNFMFDLATRGVDPAAIERLDLSSWERAFCGAEPIRAETIERFTARFSPHGFRAESFYSCYGLAEATLFVTGNVPGRPPRLRAPAAGGRPQVSCGVPGPGVQMRIVDPATGAERSEGCEGEIWVAGPSVARGYWKRPDASAQTFGARLAGDPERRYLRTGDVGFVQDGELFVTGRLKDMIIVRGRKLAPQDLELEAAASHPALRVDGAAAFALDTDGEDQIVVVAELGREFYRRPVLWTEIQTAVRRALLRAYEVRVGDIVLLKTGALPRTSSGKVRRTQCRRDYLDGRLAAAEPRGTGAAYA